MSLNLHEFVRESNRIEGIRREPTPQEVEALDSFLCAPVVTVVRLTTLVSVMQPGARLRDREGLNVWVGPHIPPLGGPEIVTALISLLTQVTEGMSPYEAHQAYETLHPFTDGNGRSGRAIWLWQMTKQGCAPLGFLHHWYYQSLQGARKP